MLGNSCDALRIRGIRVWGTLRIEQGADPLFLPERPSHRASRVIVESFIGRCGESGLPAMVDPISGAGEKVCQMHITKTVTGRAERGFFELIRGKATLRATFLVSKRVKLSVQGGKVMPGPGRTPRGSWW